MAEQTYMKLNDKVKRPVFNPDKIDTKNTAFTKLVNTYIKWFGEIIDAEDRETYEKEILSLFKEHDLDGYHLAQVLEKTVYLEPDSSLVDILDGVAYVKRVLTDAQITQWVKENYLTVPKSALGKTVTYKGKTKYITYIFEAEYRVVLSETPFAPEGCIVGFEEIADTNKEIEHKESVEILKHQ